MRLWERASQSPRTAHRKLRMTKRPAGRIVHYDCIDVILNRRKRLTVSNVIADSHVEQRQNRRVLVASCESEMKHLLLLPPGAPSPLRSDLFAIRFDFRAPTYRMVFTLPKSNNPKSEYKRNTTEITSRIVSSNSQKAAWLFQSCPY
jgi:hypothetical protein